MASTRDSTCNAAMASLRAPLFAALQADQRPMHDLGCGISGAEACRIRAKFSTQKMVAAARVATRKAGAARAAARACARRACQHALSGQCGITRKSVSAVCSAAASVSNASARLASSPTNACAWQQGHAQVMTCRSQLRDVRAVLCAHTTCEKSGMLHLPLPRPCPCPCSLSLTLLPVPCLCVCPLPPQLPLNCGRPYRCCCSRERGERRGE